MNKVAQMGYINKTKQRWVSGIVLIDTKGKEEFVSLIQPLTLLKNDKLKIELYLEAENEP